MPKQVVKTPAILAAMQKHAGEGVDVSALPAWEGIVANNLPIQKKGHIWNGAVMQPSMLNGIADKINAGGAPFHTLHQQGDELPVGKVFHAQPMENEQGLPETRAMFYVTPTDSNADLIAGLDSGAIDVLSLGVAAKALLCSECGFDYLGPDASISNLYDQTCANGHEIGTDGTHLNLSGVDKLYELSAVSQGAIQGSKIVPGSKARMQLAATADNKSPILFLSIKEPRLMADKSDPTILELAGQVSTANVALAAATANVATLTASVTALTADKTALTAQVATLTTENTTLKATPDATKLAAETASLMGATTFLKAQATKALTATGGDPKTVDAMDVAALTATIEAAQAKLATLIPGGGKGLAANSGKTEDEAAKSASMSAFTTRKS